MAEDPADFPGWLAQARAGSTEALGQALEACRGYLLLIAQQELGADLKAKGGASDLVQETFLKAHRHFARFHGNVESELLSWLRRLLLNTLIDFRRLYAETAKRRASREVSLGSTDSSYAPGDGLPANQPSPSGVAMAHEREQAFQRALDRLPDDYRLVLLLRYQEGHSFEEISRLMNRSPNAVRKLWARAAERLQQEWEQPP
jgi:RNA polymerase sigma-70 factor, ECF subfamily